jgi:hypothetical protein
LSRHLHPNVSDGEAGECCLVLASRSSRAEARPAADKLAQVEGRRGAEAECSLRVAELRARVKQLQRLAESPAWAEQLL